MKCPKCGFNSFEDSDICKKCSHDLTAHKTTYGLSSIVLQKETRAAMARAIAAQAPPEAAQQPAEQPSDIFTFDLPADATSAPAKGSAVRADSFSFNEKPAVSSPDVLDAFSFDDDRLNIADKSSGDVFADFLEPTTHQGTPRPAVPDTPLSGSEQADDSGEYDLSNFSWDDTPEISRNGIKKPVDDFDTLFGPDEVSEKK